MSEIQTATKRPGCPKSKMTLRSIQDSCTNTFCGSTLSSHCFQDDELHAYIEITERLIMARPIRRSILEPVESGDKNVPLPMRRSLFAHVPPFIIFQNNDRSKLPAEITKHLLWWQTKKRAPRIVASIVQKSGFRTTSSSAAAWCGTCRSSSACSKMKYTKNFSKLSHFPSSMELGNKQALWRNYQRMRWRFGSSSFNYMPLTFVLPEERTTLKMFMQRNGGFWIVKPPNSCAGCGITIVSRLYEIPHSCPLVVQRYISWPRLIDGIKFDMRVYVLLTSIDPLRLYVYKEGLVRFATVKYMNNVNTLSDRYMHLTNTSVNKYSPNFQPNDDLNECKGNMWSLNCLWKYLASIEKVNPADIWSKIKDIAIKTIISVEPALVNAWRKTSMSAYNFYQVFGFDILLDRQYRPWLLEVNGFPSMDPTTPLCKIVKGQLTKDYLNLVGFHVPDLLSNKELRMLKLMYNENEICYNRHLYPNGITWEDRRKQYNCLKKSGRNYCFKSILKSLSPDDVRILIKHEDEITQADRFERIFPTCNTYKYFGFFEEIRYYNLLLHAWESEYADNRWRGIERLRKLCDRKYHLS